MEIPSQRKPSPLSWAGHSVVFASFITSTKVNQGMFSLVGMLVGRIIQELFIFTICDGKVAHWPWKKPLEFGGRLDYQLH